MFSFQDFMGKSDPYLEFSRRMPDGGYQVVHRTEVRQSELKCWCVIVSKSFFQKDFVIFNIYYELNDFVMDDA